MLTKEHYSDYEKNNPFMFYNHIVICQADTACSIVRVQLTAESKNLHGYAHGGLLYAMADCVAGIAARADGNDYVTQSAHINFLSNIKEGTIYAKAETVKRGHKIAVFHISITDGCDRLLADGVVDMFRIQDRGNL